MKLFKKKFKAAINDASLPKTRKELFKVVLKEDFSLIVDISLIGFLFSLPLVVCIGIVIMLLTGIGDINVNSVTPLIFFGGLLAIPSFMIKYMGRASLYGVMKKRVHNEAGFLSESFKTSFKENFRKGIVNGLVVGIGFFIGIVGSVYFLVQTSNNIAKGLGIGVCIIICFVMFISSEYHMSICNFYELKMFDGYKNSFIFLLADLFVNILYFVILVVLPIVLTIFTTIAFYVSLLLYCFLLEGLSILFLTLRSHKLFDAYINSEYYPDIVNKGLYKEIKED